MPMRILFMGTPEISAICLSRLIDDGFSVVAVATGEDKPRGRGNVMTPSPVKVVAGEHGIPVYQPKTLRGGAFAEPLAAIAPDVIVVVAYGKILPADVLAFPKYGCINLHVSLLPKYRGAAPMQRAVMNGERETGVTVMQMDEGVDTGDILAVERFPIAETDTFGTVHDRSAEVGARLLSATLRAVEAGDLHPTKQPEEGATYAAKIEKEECAVDFSKDARAVADKIRGLSPIPTAVCRHRGKLLKLLFATPTEGTGFPGEVLATDGTGEGSITVACGKDAVKILSLIPEGKGKMSAGDFVRGRKIEKGEVLS